MGIYIPGMELPTSCACCPLAEDDGRFCRAAVAYIPMTGHPWFCPLVEVPAHGRLVDSDAFSFEMRERQEAARKWKEEARDSETAARADAVLSFLCEVKLTLDKLPTVIPKEEA